MIKYTKFIKSINLKALLYRKREYYLKYTSKKQQASNYSNFRILQIIRKIKILIIRYLNAKNLVMDIN